MKRIVSNATHIKRKIEHKSSSKEIQVNEYKEIQFNEHSKEIQCNEHKEIQFNEHEMLNVILFCCFEFLFYNGIFFSERVHF